MLLLHIGGQEENDMNCKCGHDRDIHKESGGRSFCFALVSRVPKRFCPCRKFEEEI
jgi:hypothetical protein